MTARVWRMEDLFEPGARGRAEAAARAGDTTARAALNDLATAIREIEAEPTLGERLP